VPALDELGADDERLADERGRLVAGQREGRHDGP
jgi:hypothetical protein